MDDPDSVKGAWGLLKVSPPEPVCMTVPRGNTGVLATPSHPPSCECSAAAQRGSGETCAGAGGAGAAHALRAHRRPEKAQPPGGRRRPQLLGAECGWRAAQKPRGTPQALWGLLVQPPASSPAPAAEASCPSSDILSAGLAHPPPQATWPLILLPRSPPDCSSTPRLREGPGYMRASLSGC